MRAISAVDFIRQILVHGLQYEAPRYRRRFPFCAQARGRGRGAGQGGQGTRLCRSSRYRASLLTASGSAVRPFARRARQAICRGATALLGRPYRMSGKHHSRRKGGPQPGVSDGQRRSQAAQECGHGHISRCASIGLNGGPRDGVASVGSRPTFNGTKPMLEVHSCSTSSRTSTGNTSTWTSSRTCATRRNTRMSSELVAQMHVDADNARSILAASHGLKGPEV